MMTILGNGSRRIGRIGMLGQKVTCIGVKEDLNKSIVDFFRADCGANAVYALLENPLLVAIDFGPTSLWRGTSCLIRVSSTGPK